MTAPAIVPPDNPVFWGRGLELEFTENDPEISND
jgi:hypothetical protein